MVRGRVVTEPGLGEGAATAGDGAGRDGPVAPVTHDWKEKKIINILGQAVEKGAKA